MLFAPFLDRGVDRGEPVLERGKRQPLHLFQPGPPGVDPLDEFAIALLHRLVDPHRLVTQRGKPCLRGFHRMLVDRLNLADRVGQAFAKLVDPALSRRQRLYFATVQIRAEALATFAQRGEARIRHCLEFGDPVAQSGQRAVDLGAEMFDMPLTRLAEFVEFGEAACQAVKRALRAFARRADGVGGIARGIGDHRQIVTQAGHVGQRGFGDAGDPFDLFAVFGHQRFDPVGILRQARGGDPAVRFQFAGLLGQELARQAQLAVDRGEPGFKLRNIHRSSAGRRPEARALAAHALARGEPCEGDQEGGDGPGDDCIGPHARGHPGETVRPARDHEQRGPPGQCDQRNGGDQRAGDARHPLCGRILFVHQPFLVRKSDRFAGRARGILRLWLRRVLADYSDRRTPTHDQRLTTFPGRLNPTLTHRSLE